MRHHRWLKMREALLQAEPQAGQAILHRLPCTTLQAWLAHHAWHTAQEHFRGEALSAEGDYEEHQAWEIAQRETAQVHEGVAEEFWQVRTRCACLAHKVAREYRLIYTALTGAPLQDEPDSV
jgi:hypothetical protein